ncbi:unnamed protein product [Urochloa humidicola]
MEVVKDPATQPRLPPGFRFRPTDDLRRRALSSPLPAAVDIPDVCILAHDPSDLLSPGWSEQERYFFTCKEAKYVKGRRANRGHGGGVLEGHEEGEADHRSAPDDRSSRGRISHVRPELGRISSS